MNNTETAEEKEEEKIRIKWHRLFGVTLIDYFTHSNYEVELEKELSLKKQYLDIAIIKKRVGTPLKNMPVGLETLAEYNLMTYKSLHEPLDDWAIEELIGYYSNYRKIISPSLQKLLPNKQFKLYAICTRYPTKLLSNDMLMTPLATGIYNVIWGKRTITIIVLSLVAKEIHNALWKLFSGNKEGFIFGSDHYQWKCKEEEGALNQLYRLYKIKGGKMSYTMEDFTKDYMKEHLHVLDVHDRLQGMAASDRLKGMAASDRLQGMSAKDIKAYLASIEKEPK